MSYVGYGRYKGDNRVAGVEDQEHVQDLINDDLDNNPSVPQGIAGLAESI